MNVRNELRRTSKQDRRRRSAKPLAQIKIAKERMAILIAEAEKTDDPKMAKRYVELTKKIGMRYNVRLPKQTKRYFCKYCHVRLLSGWRTKNGIKYIICKSCGKTIRFPFRK